MQSLAVRILLALAQAFMLLLLMVKIGVTKHGAQSWRVDFWFSGSSHQGPNRPTKEEAELDKARLEAAPDEDKPGIITAMKAEKKKAMQEAEAQQKAEEATDLLRTSYNSFGSTIYCELLRICGASKSMYFYMLSRCGAANRMCFCANLLMRRSKNYVHPEAIEMMPQPLTASSRPKV